MGDTRTKGETRFDLGPFGWLVRYDHSDTWIDFRAYEVVATSLDGSQRFYERKGGNGGMDHTENPDDAECIEGYVKWDGCMEITLGRQHFCGAKDVAETGALMSKLHELCLLLPNVDRSCAEYDVTTHPAPPADPHH